MISSTITRRILEFINERIAYYQNDFGKGFEGDSPHRLLMEAERSEAIRALKYVAEFVTPHQDTHKFQSNVWMDGVCKICGCPVIETSEVSTDDLKDFANGVFTPHQGDPRCSDYKNTCINPDCSEHHWHFVGDQEELDYYDHNPSVLKKVRELFKGTVLDLKTGD